MKPYGKILIFPVVALVFAVLLLAGPGSSRAGWDEADHGTYYTGDQPARAFEIEQVGHWRRHRGHWMWYGYGAPAYGYYYGPRYYGPSVTFGFPYAYPYPYYAPGVSVRIGL